jgi:hypothetical protein
MIVVAQIYSMQIVKSKAFFCDKLALLYLLWFIDIALAVNC